jgi:hypothetical protein
MTELGGFQTAADVLSDISGRRWSRQAVQQLYVRRKTNRFPQMYEYSINGKPRKYFRIKNIRDWYTGEKYRAAFEKR